MPDQYVGPDGLAKDEKGGWLGAVELGHHGSPENDHNEQDWLFTGEGTWEEDTLKSALKAQDTD